MKCWMGHPRRVLRGIYTSFLLPPVRLLTTWMADMMAKLQKPFNVLEDGSDNLKMKIEAERRNLGL